MNDRPAGSASRAAGLADGALLAMMLVLAGVLTGALALEFGYGEAPCPLCLLERVGMFGVCIGIGLHLRGPSVRAIGLALLCALFLLVVSVGQVLLDICPRPGHDYVGSAVLGLHMPVWAVLVALGVLTGFAGVLVLFGPALWEAGVRPRLLTRLGRGATLYVAALCAVNLVAVAVSSL